MLELVFSPSDFVAVLNQTLEFAYPLVTIEGELANVRVSRGKWVYFDIKDETASVKCFGTVYVLPGPIEEGMMVRVVAAPRMHPQYNFSLNLQSVVPVGEGSLKRAADLLQDKLAQEGLFDEARKRSMPLAPERIGLITSGESAAYVDFIKILNERWGGVRVLHCDVQVQGEPAVADITRAIELMNQLSNPPEVLVITRGGGSAQDLAAFNAEQVIRAVAASRIPTLIAIGHELDISLAELAADQRASTPSNAAQLLVPDRRSVASELQMVQKQLHTQLKGLVKTQTQYFRNQSIEIGEAARRVFKRTEELTSRQRELLEALNPQTALTRGYAVIRGGGKVIKSVKTLRVGSYINIQLHDGNADATIDKVY